MKGDHAAQQRGKRRGTRRKFYNPAPLAPCQWIFAPNSTTPSAFALGIKSLLQGQTMTLQFPLIGPYAIPSVQNCASAFMFENGLPPDDWYAYNPAALNSCAPADVLQTNTLLVQKQIKPLPNMALPNLSGVNFQVNVTCSPYGPNNFIVTLNSTHLSQPVPNIPVNSMCTATESPPAQLGTCGKPLVAVASPPVYALGQTVSIAPPPASPTISLTNAIGCDTQSPLSIIKTVTNKVTNLTGGLPNIQIPVTITCQPYGNVIHLNVSSVNTSVQSFSLPSGSLCTVTEGPLPQSVPDPKACPGPGNATNAGWAAPVYMPSPPTLVVQPQPPPANPQSVRIDNTYLCVPP